MIWSKIYEAFKKESVRLFTAVVIALLVGFGFGTWTRGRTLDAEIVSSYQRVVDGLATVAENTSAAERTNSELNGTIRELAGVTSAAINTADAAIGTANQLAGISSSSLDTIGQLEQGLVDIDAIYERIRRENADVLEQQSDEDQRSGNQEQEP